MYKLCFYVPSSDIEKVKNAIFESGAGKVGNYSHCSWQTLGEGQFLGNAGSQPAIGQQGQLEKVSEYKVEMVCDDQHIHAAIQALKQSHPYEEPAYQVFLSENI